MTVIYEIGMNMINEYYEDSNMKELRAYIQIFTLRHIKKPIGQTAVSRIPKYFEPNGSSGFRTSRKMCFTLSYGRLCEPWVW